MAVIIVYGVRGYRVRFGGLGDDNYNNINNVDLDQQFNNNRRARGIEFNALRIMREDSRYFLTMSGCDNLFEEMISIPLLKDAYFKARKGKNGILLLKIPIDECVKRELAK